LGEIFDSIDYNIMKLKEISSYLNSAVPLSFQEEYDNSGLQVGSPENEISAALIALDVTEEVLLEAQQEGCNLIISHHPLIFKGLKNITGKTYTERILIKALKEDIAIYSAHTNLDALSYGVSRKMADKLSLEKIKVLVPLKHRLLKLVTFIPDSHFEKVSEEIFKAGAGVIGNYDRCGFSTKGLGSFRGNEYSDPYTGERGEIHYENETRFETVLYSHLRQDIIKALISVHPYEEVAYDLYTLENENINEGFGCVGELNKPVEERLFLENISKVFSSGGIRYSKPRGKTVKKVALCGGAGSGFLPEAIAAGADAFITSDIKYHAFFDAELELLLIDTGHYESEKFATEILYDLITKKFPKFAVRFSEVNTNPINYL
jgi:dinuclear metal center YbgI/SA1388 family protein